MNFLCPSCRTPLPRDQQALVTCTQCSVQVDLTRVDTAPGQARLWPEVDLKGETVSGHKLLQRLGSGGMGTVYEAESPAGAPVALKVLSPMLAAEPALRERFRREARALTKVQHPRVVRLFEEGEDRGFCWYSMELVKGLDLRHRLEKGVMSPDDVEALARTLLEALGAVHDAGVVHRDVKPANVLLGPEGPRLCDFGIAQVSGATTLTESAALLGSLRYMAPEQRWGKADDRSDLYALGVVLHECLSGGVPGEAPLPGSTPTHLARLIERLTHQNPAHRPPSAVEAMKLLGRLKTMRQRRLIIGASVAGVVIAGVLGALLASGDPPVEPAAPVPVVELVVDAGVPVVEAAPVDAGSIVMAGGSLDVDLTEPVAKGSLLVRVEGARSIQLDGVERPVPTEPIALDVGKHQVLVICQRRGKGGYDTSPLLNVEVTEELDAEVSWSCLTRSRIQPAKLSKPSLKPAVKAGPKNMSKAVPKPAPSSKKLKSKAEDVR